MRILLAVVVLSTVVVLAGCGAAGGQPKAMTPQTRIDLGDVPVSNDMKDVRTHEFVIRNDGTGKLKLGAARVKTLEGC